MHSPQGYETVKEYSKYEGLIDGKSDEPSGICDLQHLYVFTLEKTRHEICYTIFWFPYGNTFPIKEKTNTKLVG